MRSSAPGQPALSQGGPGWWRGAGSEALAKLISGDAQSAFIHIAEHIAGPYDVSVDFNWPGSRLARSAPLVAVGSTFLAGDGEGNRAVVEIVEVSGERSGRLDQTTWANPTDRYLQEASAAVARVLGR